ncbi:MAG TPA: VTT domain-containing protein [Nocardioidaceae bacterium]|nr:VTT domain-containing protein [Nocardioidaceae bacterium]
MPSDLPLEVAAYALLVVVVHLRAGGTYVLGRLARRAGDGTRAGRLLSRPLVRRSERLVGRFGPPAVSASFLTVGFQSAMNLTAGFLRMPLRYYLPALTVGALIWAAMYLSVGLAVLRAFRSSGTGTGATAVLLVVLVAGLTLGVRRRWLASVATD